MNNEKKREKTPDFVVKEFSEEESWQMYKYYAQKYRLWSKFDEGIWMDEGLLQILIFRKLV